MQRAMSAYLLAALLVVQLACGFVPRAGLKSPRQAPARPAGLSGPRRGTELSGSALDSFIVCLQATSKTTTIDDPTAGMTPEEITNYISNVGGGMCNAPEPVRAAIGLALNLSLIVFGLFTVSYVVLGGLNFALEKEVEGLVDDVQSDKKGKKTFSDMASEAWNAPIKTPPPPGSSGDGAPSREQRRLQSRIKKNDK